MTSGNRILFLVLIGPLFVAPLHGAETRHKEVLLSEIFRCGTPPVIDGVPNDDCWKVLPVLTDFVTGLYSYGKPHIEHPPATRQTLVKLCYDEQNLYLALELREPHPERIITTIITRDGPVWDDDSVEIYLEPGCTKKRYYVFSTNFLGTRRDASWEYRYDNFIVDEKWGGKTQWHAGASKDANAWYLEIAIPFSDMDGALPAKSGDLWSLQIVRFCRTLMEGAQSNSYDERTFEYSSWAPGGNFKEPDKFGFILFSDAFTRIEQLIREKLSPAMGTRNLLFRMGDGVFQYTDNAQIVAEAVGETREALGKTRDLFDRLNKTWDEKTVGEFKSRLQALETDVARLEKTPNRATFSSDRQWLLDQIHAVTMELQERNLRELLKTGGESSP